MSPKKKSDEKRKLHLRNKNRGRYDLNALVMAKPELKNHIRPNKFGNESVDFSDPLAVKQLNAAILSHYYGIQYWDFPDDNLCPPIPGRADYLHYMADLLAENNSGNIPKGNKITCLDIGTGASCIYPILGVIEYDWNFIGSDCNPKSLTSANQIIESNTSLHNKIDLRFQKKSDNIFRGILAKGENIDLSICNPPFHSSLEEAQNATRRKIKNLSGRNEKILERNFAGINRELIYKGGEYNFIHRMIIESKMYSRNCFFFSSLVSKQSNLDRIYALLEDVEANQIKTISMGTGNKSSRIVAWSFLTEKEQKEWRESRWTID